MRTVLIATSLFAMLPVVAAEDKDPASLERLADIVTLPPVSWWPPAPGWYAVMGIVLLLFMSIAIMMWQHKRRNAYRAAALAELKQVGKGPQAANRIAQILKRTALTIAPRNSVASLTGDNWVQWLNQTGNGVVFSETASKILSTDLYSVEQADDEAIDALAHTAQAWITQHRAVSIPDAEVMGKACR